MSFPDDAWLDRIRASIGELPDRRRERFETEYGLSAYDANVLVEQGQDVADYFDAVARASGEAKLASNWIQQDILRTLHRVSEDRTTLAIAHRLSTIADADRILVLDQGRLAESGTHAQLLREGGLYAEMWARQQAESEAESEAAE